MPRGLTGTIAAADADPHALGVPRIFRRRLGFLAIGLVAYVVALVAGWPARFVVDGRQVSGTIWRGEVVAEEGVALAWRWAPGRSLARLGFAADWRITGAGTDLTGSAVRRPGVLILDGISGRVEAVLRAGCTVGATVDVPRVVLAGGTSRAEGVMRTSQAVCNGVPLPEMLLKIDETRLILSPAATPRVTIAEGRIANGRLTLTPRGKWAGVLPHIDRALEIMPPPDR